MGPLRGLRIIEFAGLGPAPMAAMLLADMGATVLRVARAEPVELGLPRPEHLDLKCTAGKRLALELIASADGSIEGLRPGAMERLGLGPDDCLAVNPRLVYGRMTGWGQDGPLAKAAGHDLNYIALTSFLSQH